MRSVLDARFAAAYSHLALAYITEGTIYAARPYHDAAKLAEGMARIAISNDPHDADAQAALAFVAYTDANREEALERSALALSGNPNSAWAHGVNGLLLIWNGQPSEGRGELLVALRLNPRDPRNARLESNIVVSYYYEHDYERAVEAGKRVVRRYSEYPHPYCWLAAALGMSGRTSEAREVLRQAIAVSPTAFDFYVQSRPPYFTASQHKHLLEGLRKAGWQG